MRIKVTDLDALRYYKGSEQALDDLLARLYRREPPTEKMRAGIALHGALEHLRVAGALDEVEHDGYTFRFECDGALALPKMRELKGEVEVDGHTLVGVVDALHGLTVYDHKLTGGFDAENYTDAIQWRAYLWMFGAQRFTYNVFTGTEESPRVWRIRSFDTFTCHRYASMGHEVVAAVREFADFARTHMPDRFAA